MPGTYSVNLCLANRRVHDSMIFTLAVIDGETIAIIIPLCVPLSYLLEGHPYNSLQSFRLINICTFLAEAVESPRNPAVPAVVGVLLLLLLIFVSTYVVVRYVRRQRGGPNCTKETYSNLPSEDDEV